jgi:hypothetical protein
MSLIGKQRQQLSNQKTTSLLNLPGIFRFVQDFRPFGLTAISEPIV